MDHPLEGVLLSGDRSLGPEDRIPTSVLATAAERALTEWRAEGRGPTSETEVARELARLAAAIHGRANGQPAALDDLKGTPLRRRLLELLGNQLIQGWARAEAPPRHSTVLRIFHAVETVRQALEPDRSPPVGLDLSEIEGMELMAEIAHDLRSPLTSILTLADALRRGQAGEVNELQRRQLSLIYSAALALSSTTSDFIELAHQGDRLAERERSPFSIAEVFESVQQMVQPMAESKGLELRLSVHADDRRQGYPVPLCRVLLNLTTNAIKFTESGHVELSAREVRPGRVEFAIEDTGKGIGEEAQRTLFHPFKRAPGREGRFSGTGLGLAICRRLVEAMGSSLEYDTEPDKGTCFYFELKAPPIR